MARPHDPLLSRERFGDATPGVIRMADGWAYARVVHNAVKTPHRHASSLRSGAAPASGCKAPARRLTRLLRHGSRSGDRFSAGGARCTPHAPMWAFNESLIVTRRFIVSRRCRTRRPTLPLHWRACDTPLLSQTPLCRTAPSCSSARGEARVSCLKALVPGTCILGSRFGLGLGMSLNDGVVWCGTVARP